VSFSHFENAPEGVFWILILNFHLNSVDAFDSFKELLAGLVSAGLSPLAPGSFDTLENHCHMTNNVVISMVICMEIKPLLIMCLMLKQVLGSGKQRIA
jgi:hypothetical protein